jgi:DNA primase
VIPQGFIEELLARADIVEVVGRSVQLKKAGTNYKGLCPFHSEKTPSFTVSPSKQFYHCFGCGAHGTALGFLMEHLGLGFRDSVRELAGQLGMSLPDDDDPQAAQQAQARRSLRQGLTDVLEQANRHYRDRLRESRRAIDYLKGRGLTGRIAARFGLGYATDDWQGLAAAFPNYDADPLVQSGLVVARDANGDTLEPSSVPGSTVARRYDRLRDRITFPIRNAQGELIGFGGRVLGSGEPKYLNSPETVLFHKGEELYGLFEARAAVQRKGQALVVEGYLDVIALAQHGIEHVVATLGTACTAEHVKRLFRHCAQIVFAFDGDSAGRRAAARALESALPALADERSVKFLFLPAEHDPDSYVRALGADAFERELAHAQPLSVFLLDHVGDGLALTTAEGRAQAIARARPLLALLPECALKGQIVGEFARRLQTPAAEVRAELAPRGAAAAPTPRAGGAARGRRGHDGVPPRASRLSAPRTDHAHTALRILFAQPELWAQLSTAQHALLMAQGEATRQLAGWLATRLDVEPQMSAAALWEALRADGLLEQAGALAPGDLLELDTAALTDHLHGALDSVEHAWIKRRQQELAADGLRSDDARLEYSALSARLRELGRKLPRL